MNYVLTFRSEARDELEDAYNYDRKSAMCDRFIDRELLEHSAGIEN